MTTPAPTPLEREALLDLLEAHPSVTGGSPALALADHLLASGQVRVTLLPPPSLLELQARARQLLHNEEESDPGFRAAATHLLRDLTRVAEPGEPDLQFLLARHLTPGGLQGDDPASYLDAARRLLDRFEGQGPRLTRTPEQEAYLRTPDGGPGTRTHVQEVVGAWSPDAGDEEPS